ncbi:MAG: hypothetical protein ACRDHU_12485, partial [Actinomycetota bacterium]
MSARLELDRTRSAAGLAVVAASVGVLAVRPFVAETPSARVGLFVASYAAIGLAAIAVPGAGGRPGLPPVVVLGIGVAAIAAAAVAAGTPVPVPWGPAALPVSL